MSYPFQMLGTGFNPGLADGLQPLPALAGLPPVNQQPQQGGGFQIPGGLFQNGGLTNGINTFGSNVFGLANPTTLSGPAFGGSPFTINVPTTANGGMFAGSGASLSGVLGAAGLGAMGGSFLGKLGGNTTNGSLGGGAGAGIGMAMGGPVGAIAGGLLGGVAGGFLGPSKPPMVASEVLMNFKNDPTGRAYISGRTFGTKGADESQATRVSDDFGSYVAGLSDLGINAKGLKFHAGYNDKYEGGFFIKNKKNKNSKDTYKESTAHFKDGDPSSKYAAYQQVMIDSLREHNRLTPEIEKKIREYKPAGVNVGGGQMMSGPVVSVPKKEESTFKDYVDNYRKKQTEGAAK